MKIFWSSIFCITLITILSNCSNGTSNTNQTILHPNDDSELTLLMREMYDYVYLESAKRLKTSKSNIPEVFNHMIDDCMNCHKQMCPGPMVKIKKLYLASVD